MGTVGQSLVHAIPVNANGAIRILAWLVLQNELQQHTCPVCFEPMLPPDRSPMLLFPCGHTFCQECLEKTLDSKNACPTCRAAVQQTRPNHALRDLMACLPEPDHETDRVKQYKAEYALQKEFMNKKWSRLCAEMDKIAELVCLA